MEGKSGNVATQCKMASPGIFTRQDRKGPSWTTLSAAAKGSGIGLSTLAMALNRASKAAPGRTRVTFKCKNITWIFTRNGA